MKVSGICLMGEICLLACLPTCFNFPCEFRCKFSTWVSWKVFCCFWPIKLQFISRCISCSYFSGNFPSFLLWYDLKILVKSMGEGTILFLAHCLLTFGRSNFFQLKAKYPVFHFLDLYGTIFNLILLKISKKYQNFHCFLKFSLFYPNYDFRILVQIYQSVV